jgi:drug/metabolite transporter (DMT)-like permease
MSDAPRRVTLLASLTLLVIAASWGSTFFLIHDLLDRVPVVDFLAVRFAIASVTLLLLAPRAIGRLSAEKRNHALVLGMLYGVAQIMQTTGLGHTAASVSGFITGLYVVCTPLFAALLLKSRINRMTWGAVLLALVGLGVLTLSGISIGFGEAITFVAALIYALHIVALGAWSTTADAIGMATVQIMVITVLATVCALPGGIALPQTGGDWFAVVYMAVIAGGLAMLGQTWAQAHLDSTRSAIIMSMEPVFAAFFAVVLGSEGVTWRMLVGGSLVLAAMLVVELSPRRRIETEVPHLAV